MTLLRSLTFNLFLYLWTAFIATIGLPLMFLHTQGAIYIGRTWARGCLGGLRLLCNIHYRIEGEEHLPRSGAYIIASKHQSAWDTIIFLATLPAPAYVLKKELLKLPFYGWYLPRMGMIAVDRSAGASALKDMVKQAQDRIQHGRPIVIFPEGTRTTVGATPAYHPGVAALYNNTGIAVIPAAVNSGLLWGRNAFVKKPGTITLRYLPAIPPGTDRKAFMGVLTEQIEHATAELVERGTGKALSSQI